MLVLLGLVGAAPFLACVVAWRLSKSTSPGWRLARAAGWCSACVAPAIVLQDALLLAGRTSTSVRALDCLSMLPFQIWVLQGGAVVQFLFEATAEELSGHRQSTMMDNAAIYFAYTIAWVLAWSLVVRTRDAVPARRDPVRWIVGAILVLNSIAGASWPWWGT